MERGNIPSGRTQTAAVSANGLAGRPDGGADPWFLLPGGGPLSGVGSDKGSGSCVKVSDAPWNQGIPRQLRQLALKISRMDKECSRSPFIAILNVVMVL